MLNICEGTFIVLKCLSLTEVNDSSCNARRADDSLMRTRRRAKSRAHAHMPIRSIFFL